MGGKSLKVGILTYHNPLNHGARLQAYGLQEVVRWLGHEPVIVDYRGERYKPVRIRDFLRFRSPGYHVSLYNAYLKAKAYEQEPMPFSLTERTYETTRDLFLNPPGCDAYICGSDQVWQPKKNRDGRIVRSEFFLEFAEKEALRVAYAPSFGQPLSKEYVNAISPYVKKLDAISVREPDEISRLQIATGRKDIECVCDPTILYGPKGFRALYANAKKMRGGLFCYLLSVDMSKDAAIIKAVSNRFGPVTFDSRPIKFATLGRNAHLNPQMWLSAIDGADFVVTNSFHGTAFSLMFHKSFICLKWAKPSFNVRMSRLLEKVGLSDRMLGSADVAKVETIIGKQIDWGSVDSALGIMRENSLAFLKHSLEMKR